MLNLKTVKKILKKIANMLKKLLNKKNLIVLALFTLLVVFSSSFDIVEGIADKLNKGDKRTVHQNTQDKQSSKMMIELNKNNLSAKVNKKYDSCLGKYDCEGEDTSKIKTIPFIDRGCIASDGTKLNAKDDSDCAHQKIIYQNKKQSSLLNN